jgi:hypothetical protein
LELEWPGQQRHWEEETTVEVDAQKGGWAMSVAVAVAVAVAAAPGAAADELPELDPASALDERWVVAASQSPPCLLQETAEKREKHPYIQFYGN